MRTTLFFILLFSTGLFAQKEGLQKEVIKQGELTKYIEYYGNGTIAQTGFFKDNQLHGQWISYDQLGNKRSMGNYENGKKTSQWIFWSKTNLIEVEYINNRITKTVVWDRSDVLANVETLTN